MTPGRCGGAAASATLRRSVPEPRPRRWHTGHRAESRFGMVVHRGSSVANVIAMSEGGLNVRERRSLGVRGHLRPYLTDTAITFEIDPPLPAEMSARIAAAVRTHAWVVLEVQERVLGYAYGGPHKSRPACAGRARSASISSVADGVLAAVVRSTMRSSCV